MKKILLLMCLFIISSTSFSQTIDYSKEYEQVSKKAVKIMRRKFNIPKKTKLSTFVLPEFGSSTDFLYKESPLAYPNRYTVGECLRNISIMYTEIFIFDESLEHLYVYNRQYIGGGKFKKEYYLCKPYDKRMMSYIIKNKYEYAYNLSGIRSVDASIVLLCFKSEKMFLVNITHDEIKTKQVTENDYLEKL